MMTEKRFVKIKKDGTYYVRDNKLDTSFPIHEISLYGEYYSASVDYIIEKLNQENNNINDGIIMDWQDIVFELLDDEMIKSCGCDGLWDANRVLNGLFAMNEIMFSSPRFNNDFILEAINAAIKARNRYCSLNGTDELPYVRLVDGEFVW